MPRGIWLMVYGVCTHACARTCVLILVSLTLADMHVHACTWRGSVCGGEGRCVCGGGDEGDVGAHAHVWAWVWACNMCADVFGWGVVHARGGYWRMGHSRSLSAGHSSIKSQGHSYIKSQGHSSLKSQGHSSLKSQGHSFIKSQGHSSIKSQGHSYIKSQGHSFIKSQGP